MTAVLLLAVVLLVLVNGFFVAAEFALVRVRPNRLEEMRDDGRRGAKLALEIHQDLNEYLSACQFGITLASLGIGFLGEPAIAEMVEPDLRRHHLPRARDRHLDRDRVRRRDRRPHHGG